jgi:hypothetical protein
MGVWYCLREQVKLAVDVKDSARANAQIDRIIDDVSGVIRRTLRRVIEPRLMTQTWDWPAEDRPTPGRLWLGGQSEVAELVSVTSAGTAIAPSSVRLYPTYGPPYTRLELDIGGAASFGGGNSPQQTIAVTALYAGAPVVERDVTTLGAGVTSVEDTITVASVDQLGVGALIKVGDERMQVTGTAALDTGLDLAGNVTVQMNAITIPLSGTTGAPQPNEIIAVDAERMLVVDVIGANVFVQRAYDGSPAAAHSTGAGVYAYRTLRVDRGVLGTTAAAHLTGDVVARWIPVAEGLAVAETLNQLEQERSAYARVIGTGDAQSEARGAGLKDKRTAFYKAYQRRVRMGAV